MRDNKALTTKDACTAVGRLETIQTGYQTKTLLTVLQIILMLSLEDPFNEILLIQTKLDEELAESGSEQFVQNSPVSLRAAFSEDLNFHT